jgi:hypothetical protein
MLYCKHHGPIHQTLILYIRTLKGTRRPACPYCYATLMKGASK